MRSNLVLTWPIIALILVLCSACEQEQATNKPAQSNAGSQVAEHSHDEADKLVWEVTEKLGESKYDVRWGHHGNHFHSGDKIEPAVSIMLEGKPFAEAKVFNSIVAAVDSSEVLVDELPTVYEPKTADEPAHYAQGALMIPSTATSCVLRFRVEIEGQPAHIRDVTVNTGH